MSAAEIDIAHSHRPGPTAFVATKSDQCGKCFKPIEVGDTCHYTRDGELVHHIHRKPEPVYDICPTCFLTRPCEC